MAVQTTYNTEHAAAYAGMPADGQLCNTVSRLNASGATIAYGLGVVTDTTVTTSDAATVPTGASTAAQFNGVVMREVNRAYADGETFGALNERDMTVINQGVVWVEVLDTVAKDAPVYLRVGATGNGKFSGVVGSGATLGVLIPDAKFVSGGEAGDLVKISLGLGG